MRLGDELIAEDARYLRRDRTIYDSWHSLPVLVRRPGALRNGASFKDWVLPSALARLRRKVGSGDGPDCRFVWLLAAISGGRLDAAEAATGEAFDTGAASDEVILNILARRLDPLPHERHQTAGHQGP